MLEKLLEKFFAEDHGTAADSNDNAENIKADVLSRIEREKPMKHFRMKPLIIAAAITAIGAASIAITVNASIDSEAMDEMSRAAEEPEGYYYGDSYYILTEEDKRIKMEDTIKHKYLSGIAELALENGGGIVIESELDDTDVRGFVPYNEKTSYYVDNEEMVELARLIEEDPGLLGLELKGKSEEFKNGLRIVNIHYENNNEPADGKKPYYSVRKVYRDNAENTLIASLYMRALIDPSRVPSSGVVMTTRYRSVFFDHTDDGCRAVNEQSGGGDGTFTAEDGETIYQQCFQYFDIRPQPDEEPVRIMQYIMVTSDGVQLID